MRTDCMKLSFEVNDVIKELVLEKYGESFYHRRLSKGKKVANAQEAHEAIRPIYIDKEMTDIVD